jgi:hypothetical protein
MWGVVWLSMVSGDEMGIMLSRKYDIQNAMTHDVSLLKRKKPAYNNQST